MNSILLFIGCTIGFIFKDGSCVPCETNLYGELCVLKCTCAFHHRCGTFLGCVDKTTSTQPALSQSITYNTENFTQITANLSEIVEESVKNKPTPTINSSDEYFTQTTRPNLSEESEMTKPTSTKKSSNDQNNTSDESDKNDDTTSYLHPYHTTDEEWKEKTHQYDITHVSNKDTDDSFDSSTRMINDGYLNPYQPLNEDWKQKSHSYEAPVTVHHCQLSSTVPSVSDEELKEEGNDNNQIARIKHNKVAHISEAVISTCSKQEMTDCISLNDERKEISASIGNNHEIKKEFTNLNNISTNSPSSTQIENALVPVVKSDLKGFVENKDNPHNYNLLKNVTIHTIASIHADQNANVHNYTDAKSQ
ncbi:unnamed protein product [Mytilus coruscus]|uniref:MEGF10_11 n=1 Tax=Mytilus coruscus TaxID=42192 RepID=A0A6J8EQU6_MYTCO|nr:unnamed protein product [Mytilus coruscus]